MTYHIAYAREDGEWDIIHWFEARNNAHAEDIAWCLAEEQGVNREDWYVLDEEKNNINAW